MSDRHEVISAFIDDEPFEPRELARALADPSGRILLIDLVVSTTLLSMGMLQLPPAMVSLPFKILLFVMIDGWNLLVGSIVRSFA